MMGNEEQEKLKQVWCGRVDDEENSFRWHQQVIFDVANDVDDYQDQLVLAGFACDEGVRRNQGRTGAEDGPQAIRSALANLTCSELFRFFDIGDVVCEDTNLDHAQSALSRRVSGVLENNGFPVVLGGGHEIAYGSFVGIQNYVEKNNKKNRIGILNFDAHFDLRDPSAGANSGTPFRQCHAFCQTKKIEFHYGVLGINPSSNSQGLFDFARQHHVTWLTDAAMVCSAQNEQQEFLTAFLKKCDYLYITICLDVFSSAYAPGVSAPAAIGIHPMQAIVWLKNIFTACREMGVRPILCDIAEMNPTFDRDKQTARLAARLIYEIAELRHEYRQHEMLE